MFNLLKRLLIISTLSIAGLTTYTLLDYQESDENEQPSYIESIKLNSSRFTQVDDLGMVDSDYYIEIKNSDELIAENDNLKLYYDEDIVSFKIENKTTGYVFSTHIDKAAGGTYTGLLSSGVGIEYIQVNRGMSIIENVGISDIAFTQEIKAIEDGVNISLYLGGFCPTRTCKRLYPAYLEGDYTLEEMEKIGFIELKVGFELDVILEEDGIKVSIPNESIVEDKPEFVLLSSIILFPALGATKLDEIPGYMMLPDGSGALVRYENNEGRYKSPYRAQFYGLNYGLTDNFRTISNYPLSMPIFGLVHGVNQNGLLSIIESGDYSSRLIMIPNGVYNLDYNLIFPKFDLKKTYLQRFSSDGIGGSKRFVNTLDEDIIVSYKVLSNDQANYVGMANKYQAYLDEEATFKTVSQKTNIPLQLTYLMADSKNALFGTKAIQMSTAEDVSTMHEYFLSQNLDNFEVALMGWNKGGYSGYLPSPVNFENSLGSNARFKEMIAYLEETSQVSLINNYVMSGENAKGILDRRDIAKGVDRFRITFDCPACVYQTTSLLYPKSSYDLASKHYEDYQDLGVDVLFEHLGSTSFSYYDSNFYTQTDAINHYLEIMKMYDKQASYIYPNAYAYQYVNSFMGTPMFNSQLNFFDDLVPVLQISLMGKIPMFSNYLNFNSYGKDFLLQLVDFNVYPAYVLTMNKVSDLKNTDVNNIYTSEFALWKETIVDEYSFINDALKYVKGETMISRETVLPGVVKNTYSNGIIIYINYSSSSKTIDGITVGATTYVLGGGFNG